MASSMETMLSSRARGDLLVGYRDLARDTVEEVASVYGVGWGRIIKFGKSRAHLDLNFFSGTFSDQDVVGPLM